MKRYIPRIAIYRCGCSEKYRTEIGKTEGYIFTFYHNGPDGIAEPGCPNHKEPLAILSESGYSKTAEWEIVRGVNVNRLLPSVFADDEMAVEFK